MIVVEETLINILGISLYLPSIFYLMQNLKSKGWGVKKERNFHFFEALSREKYTLVPFPNLSINGSLN